MRGVQDLRQRKKFLVKAGLLLVLALTAVLLLKYKHTYLLEQSVRILQSSFSKNGEYKVHIGGIEGGLWGDILFKDVIIERPWMPPPYREFVRAESIAFRYNPASFFVRTGQNVFEVTLRRPKILFAPGSAGLDHSPGPALKWLRQWALSQRDRIEVRVANGTLVYGDMTVTGIDFVYDRGSIEMDLPFSHIPIFGSDVSTVIKLTGDFKQKTPLFPESLSGTINTEGTVINWKPLEYESHFEYTLTDSFVYLSSEDFLGGFKLSAAIDFEAENSLRLSLSGVNYPLANLWPFFKLGDNVKPATKIDLEGRLHGPLTAPAIDAKARILDGWMSKRPFKAFDVEIDGVVPTVKISNSRVLLDDGQQMKFADKVVEFWELFKKETYERLISEAEQDTVVWGSWEISRPIDRNEQPEFLLERLLGPGARMRVRKFNEEERLPEYMPDDSRPRDVEVGFEYRLKSKDSLKLQFKDDEEILGIERKLTF